MIQDSDMPHLQRCVELAREALEAGDEPFGSVLMAADGSVLAEERNRISGGGPVPELAEEVLALHKQLHGQA